MKVFHEISCCGDMVRVRLSRLREGSLRINTKLFWVITFILWWNTSILLGTVSSVITMSHPEGLTELCDEYGNYLNHTLQPWQSTDLNPAERLWEILDWQRYLPMSSKHQNIEHHQVEWRSIPPAQFHSLIESIAMCIEAAPGGMWWLKVAVFPFNLYSGTSVKRFRSSIRLRLLCPVTTGNKPTRYPSVIRCGLPHSCSELVLDFSTKDCVQSCAFDFVSILF